MTVTISKPTLALIKSFEGLRLTAYQDSVGVYTIGYGTTAAAGVGIKPAAGMTITQADAERYLVAALAKFGAQIAPLITYPLSPNAFGACLSLAYNIGPGNFARSTVLRKINEGDLPGAAAAFASWNKAGGKVLPGLTRRRAAEAALFQTA